MLIKTEVRVEAGEAKSAPGRLHEGPLGACHRIFNGLSGRITGDGVFVTAAGASEQVEREWNRA